MHPVNSELCSDKYLNMCIFILFSKSVLNLCIPSVPDLFVKLITVLINLFCLFSDLFGLIKQKNVTKKHDGH